MKVVTLVPWRGGDELREQSWDIVRPYLERFGWRIYLGDREGPRSRGAASSRSCSLSRRNRRGVGAKTYTESDAIPIHLMGEAGVTEIASADPVPSLVVPAKA